MMFPRQHMAWGKSETIPDAEDNIQLADNAIHTQMSVFSGTQLSWLGLGRLEFQSTMVTLPFSKPENLSSCAEKEQADNRVQAAALGLSLCRGSQCGSLSHSGDAHTFESHFCLHASWKHKYPHFILNLRVVPSDRLLAQGDTHLLRIFKMSLWKL